MCSHVRTEHATTSFSSLLYLGHGHQGRHRGSLYVSRAQFQLLAARLSRDDAYFITRSPLPGLRHLFQFPPQLPFDVLAVYVLTHIPPLTFF